ncbi:hypothetical protein B0H13DRAFT_1933892 [Mycena leptocephala]|nr:hypothetical protein B0H13DRAFT_1933892 [Mycena leptocephala]
MTVVFYQGQASERFGDANSDDMRCFGAEISTFRRLQFFISIQPSEFGPGYAARPQRAPRVELLPVEETLRMNRHSPISTVYLMGNFAWMLTTRKIICSMLPDEHSSSTLLYGSELRPVGSAYKCPTKDYPISNLVMNSLSADRLPQRALPTPSPDRESMIISTLTLDQYHKISWNEMFPVGAIVWMSRNSFGFHYNMVEIAHVVDRALDDSGWSLQPTSWPCRPLTDNGWTRFTSKEIEMTNHRCIERHIRSHVDDSEGETFAAENQTDDPVKTEVSDKDNLELDSIGVEYSNDHLYSLPTRQRSYLPHAGFILMLGILLASVPAWQRFSSWPRVMNSSAHVG